jgi:ABC-type multidrug transport system ATPase subunit
MPYNNIFALCLIFSTLLDLIANRKLVGNWSGEILVNDNQRSKYFSRDMSYVLQDDVHIPTLTVEETIYFSAWTRMIEGTKEKEMRERVEELLTMMGLTHVRKSLVGDSLYRGLLFSITVSTFFF